MRPADLTEPVVDPALAALEQRLAAYTGARYCVALGSGAEALALALLALGTGPGDEVITTPFGPPDAVNAITHCGATPVFVDIDRATCNIDPWLLGSAITTRTRAVVPVSMYGQPPDMEEINAIAQRHRLAVIEDASDSFGATYHGNKSCNLSTIGCTSFHPSKAPGCDGDGGALFTRDDALAKSVRDLIAGRLPNPPRQERAGQPGQLMGGRQCAALLAKLDRLDQELAQRKRLAARYEVLFACRLQRIGRRRDRESVFSGYTLVLDQRERVMAKLAAAGIAAVVHPLPFHLLARSAHLIDPQRFPVAAEIAAMVMTLPIGLEQDEASAQRIAAAVLSAAGVAVPAMDEW
jgi:UDP-2-acetamido-2-deoxy-ribo-hexuluronate aminotransferase